jgi:pimeloyl-ACP methyl ester carboxylesterase
VRGDEVLLVHGGASPATTWGALEPLGARWTLTYFQRRAGPPDFEVDADDLVGLLAGRPHVIAHSYGTLGALIAAGRAPAQVRSLTIIEAPLGQLVPGDPDVARLVAMGDAFMTHGLDTDPAMLRDFLRLAGSPGVDDGPLPEEVARGVRRAQGGRLTSEAEVPLAALRAAGIPALVASGAHDVALERICDAVAAGLGARRVVHPGAGHFVAAAPGFAKSLEAFLRSAA